MANGFIPKDSAWCSDCHMDPNAPCARHTGLDGKVVEYTGSDVYKPSSWVLEVVGKRYNGLYGVFECLGYDPRHGFWMKQIHPPYRKTNVSERAIGGSYHVIRLTYGAWLLCRFIAEHGRISRDGENPYCDAAMASKTLRSLGMIDADNMLTESGRACAAFTNFPEAKLDFHAAP